MTTASLVNCRELQSSVHASNFTWDFGRSSQPEPWLRLCFLTQSTTTNQGFTSISLKHICIAYRLKQLLASFSSFGKLVLVAWNSPVQIGLIVIIDFLILSYRCVPLHASAPRQ